MALPQLSNEPFIYNWWHLMDQPPKTHFDQYLGGPASHYTFNEPLPATYVCPTTMPHSCSLAPARSVWVPKQHHYYNNHAHAHDDAHHALREKTGASEILYDKEKYKVTLDVPHFKPEELKVNINDTCVLVEGHHEEKKDEHGFVTRSFKRRYILPKDIKPDTVTSTLSADGVLIIEAPRPPVVEEDVSKMKTIQIVPSSIKVHQERGEEAATANANKTEQK